MISNKLFLLISFIPFTDLPPISFNEPDFFDLPFLLIDFIFNTTIIFNPFFFDLYKCIPELLEINIHEPWFPFLIQLHLQQMITIVLCSILLIPIILIQYIYEPLNIQSLMSIVILKYCLISIYQCC